MPRVPRSGGACTEEILRRRALLPPDLVDDPTYAVNSHLWDRWLEMEHDHRRRLAFAATAPPDYVPADEPDDEEEEEGEGENDPVDEDGDEEEALRQAIEASELEELGRWPDLATALRASAEGAANQARM